MFVAIGPAAFAATYYVSPSGSDSNPGTSSQPYLTVARGVQQAAAGDTIVLEDGAYGNNGYISDGSGGERGFASPVTISKAGTAAAPITITAQNKGNAILNCGTTSTAMGCDVYIYLNSGAAYWNFENLVVTGGAFGGISTNSGASHITVKGCVFYNIGNWNDTTSIGETGLGFDSTATNWWVEGNVFHDIGRPNGSSLDHGIYAEGSNVTVINNIFYNITHGWSLQLANGANNWLIANNTFAFPNPTQAGQIMLWNSNTNISIENNIFYQPSSSAITRYTSTLTSCILSNNMVYGASSVISDTTGCTLSGNQTSVNPLLVNATTSPYDFHLTSGSPAIDAGLTISSITEDFDGNSRPQGAAYDIGAYEYVASTGPVISNVFVSSVTSNSAVINWTTNDASSSLAQYGTSGYTSATPENTTGVTQHSVALSGLNASTQYQFRAGSRDSSGTLALSSGSSFTTSAAPVTNQFSLTPVSGSISAVQGGIASAAINATLISGTPGNATFFTSGLPSGIASSFTSGACALSCSTTVIFGVSASAAPGTYSIGVGATATGASASTSVSLTVTAAAPPPVTNQFSLTPVSGSISAVQGSNASTGISATLISGTPGSATFSTSGLPSGDTASFTAGACSPTCSTTVTFAASASAAPGTYSVGIGATATGASASTSVSLTVTAAAPPPAPAPSGLAAWWKLTEGSGTTAHDSSGNNNSGVISDGAWATGSYGTALSLPGAAGSSYVSVPESSSIELSSQMTVSFWVNAGATSNTDPRVIAKLYSWDIKLNGSSRHPQLDAGGKYAAMNYSLPLSAWVHVVFTFNSGIVTGYIDGSPVTFSANTFKSGNTLPAEPYGLFIGTDPSKTSSYDGLVSDVRIYNTALSAAQVATLYSTTLH